MRQGSGEFRLEPSCNSLPRGQGVSGVVGVDGGLGGGKGFPFHTSCEQPRLTEGDENMSPVRRRFSQNPVF